MYVGVALRPPLVAEKGSKALSEITSKRQCIYAQRIATIFQTGGYHPPALMKYYVKIKSFDVIKVVCLNVKDCKNREYRSGGIVSDKSNYLPESK